MDEFEKNYFAKLKQMANDYQGSRNDLAKSRIKMFAAALCRQLVDQNEKFDLIVAAGNSGLYMSEITKLVYKALDINIPQIVVLPIFRFKENEGQLELNDNSSLLEQVKGKVSLPDNANILFVDDEIMQGLTVKAVLEIILAECPNIESLRCVIIAEHHFFEWHYNLPKVSINFFAYSRLIQGLNGNIGYFVPEDLFNKIKLVLSEVESYNHAMAILIGGGLKRKDQNGKAFFDFNITGDFETSKVELKQELAELVESGIKEYKSKGIQFRF